MKSFLIRHALKLAGLAMVAGFVGCAFSQNNEAALFVSASIFWGAAGSALFACAERDQ